MITTQTLMRIIETTPITLLDTNIIEHPEQDGVLRHIKKTEHVGEKDLPFLEQHKKYVSYIKELCQHPHVCFIPEITQELFTYSCALLAELNKTHKPLRMCTKTRTLLEHYLISIQALEDISKEQEIELTPAETIQHQHWVELEKTITTFLPQKYVRQQKASTTDACLVATAFYALQFGNVCILSNDSDIRWLTEATYYFIRVLEKKEQTPLLPAQLKIASYNNQRKVYAVTFTTQFPDMCKSQYVLEKRFEGATNFRTCWFTTYPYLKEALNITRKHVPNLPSLI